MKLAKQIEQLFKDRCAEFKEKYKLNFGVYFTPKLFGLGVAQVTVCKNNLTKRASVISW